MFGRKKVAPKHNVYLRLRIANTVLTGFCGRENASKLLDDTGYPTIKNTSELNKHDNFIQKAEATLVNHSPPLWYHHGCSVFASSPNMVIEIDHPTDQLLFKIVENYFTLETSDSGVCVFFAPTTHLRQLIEAGNLGYVGIDSKESEIDMPGDFKWIEGINQRIGGNLASSDRNGIDVTYTNEVAQLFICSVFEGGEHPIIKD